MTIPEKTSGIDKKTLQQLAQQLAHWAREFISAGRSPFRRVETFVPILTETGDIAPPLVFWINRDSYMAGGAVFFPEGSEASSVLEGQYAADALGLAYYVAWGAKEITLWQRHEKLWEKARTIPIGDGGHPNTVDFHDALMRLMEEMKTYSVLAAVPPDKLTPYYLANLSRATVLSLLPSLTEHFRIHRGMANSDQGGSSAERQALGKAMLTLIRIMALALHDALPKAVQPQKLEEAMGAALAALPDPLPQTLRMSSREPALPEKAQVRLHLLLHRLTQLGIARNPQRAVQALDLLQKHTAPDLGTYPLTGSIEPGAGTVLLLYPNRILDVKTPQMVVNSPPMLAFQSLLRHVDGITQPLASTTDPMALPPEPAPNRVCGSLLDSRLPSSAERQSLAAQLRLSWPARRFRLPPRAPLWAWHLLHLLGLAGDGGHFDLVTPPAWLASTYGRQLLGLLLENATLKHLRESERGLCLEFSKQQQSDSFVIIKHGTEARSISNTRLREGHVSLLSLALMLPDAIWNMIEDGRLTLATARTWPQPAEQGIFFYSRSSLGRYLWQITSGGRPLPRRTSLRSEVLRKGLPLPGQKALLSLQKLQTEGGGEPSVTILDQELALWLGATPELPAANKATPDESRDTDSHQHAEQDLLANVAELVFMDGIPVFPDHYLYDYYRPEMRRFDFEKPLSIDEEFFGTVELKDEQGYKLQVEGMETALALVLISSLRSGPVELPVDRVIISTILDRYRQDLRKLRSNLVKEIFRRQADPRTAKTLVERLWQQQPLPPWRLIA
jgi:hypothetical protein